jgi:hypothetical protein
MVDELQLGERQDAVAVGRGLEREVEAGKCLDCGLGGARCQPAAEAPYGDIDDHYKPTACMRHAERTGAHRARPPEAASRPPGNAIHAKTARIAASA